MEFFRSISDGSRHDDDDNNSNNNDPTPIIPPPPPPPSNSNYTSQQQPPQPEIVELATLALPRSAMETGLELGDGNHVVLEASNQVVENIQQAMAVAAAAIENDDETDGGHTMSTNPTYTTSIQEGPSITAVVDLEMLSELVGATEADLITGLHHEMQENRAATVAAAEEEERDDAEAIADEETPLISSVTVQEGPDGGMEALSDAGDDDDDDDDDDNLATEQITLLADPFIETLAETLPAIQEDDAMTASGDTTTLGDAITIATTTIRAADLILSGNDGGEDLEGEAVHADEKQHFAHDAFLLDVPTTNDQGNLEHKFVLALPEILIEESVQTATSALSGDEAFAIMERAMSLLPPTVRLPTDIENVHLEATEHIPTKADPTELHIDVVINRRVPIVGYVILFSGLFALASVGAALDLQQGGVSPTMKTQWRQVATSIVLLPFVIKSFWQDGKPNLTISQWSLLPVAAAAYTYMTLAFVIALEMTTLANAFVLSNMTSLVIIFGRFVLRMPVLPLEGGGAITGFLGAGICAQDAAKTMAQGDSVAVSADGVDPANLAMWGNVVALSASFGTAAYLLIAKKLRPKMDLFVFMFMIMACGSVFLLIFMVASGEEITFDTDPVHGLFGWMNLQPDRLPLELYMAIICNCLGTTGYIAVMKYFDPLVPATVMLLEPVIGALLGVAAGTAKLPGLQTWLGDLVVACGTFMVIYSGSSTEESIDATEALRPRVTTLAEDTLKSADTGAMRSPLLPRHSPALSKSPASRLRKESSNFSDGGGGGAGGTKVIWEVE